MDIIKIDDFPSEIKENQIFEIIPDKSKIVPYTNRLFNKYPTRYISAVPRYAIQNFSKKNDFVLDPFCGSGTTAIEALVNCRNAISIDIDPFARLLIKTKTAFYTNTDIKKIEDVVNTLKKLTPDTLFETPEIPDINKWFCEQSVIELSFLKHYIDLLTEENTKVRDYFYVVFASIIRKCSNADDVSPKPYISTRFKKIPKIPFELFFKNEELYRPAIIEFSNRIADFNCDSILLDSNDAKNVNYSGTVDLAVTSPPYINAYDYVRSLKFEDVWLGLADLETLRKNRKNYVGSEVKNENIINYQFIKNSNTLIDKLNIMENLDKKRKIVISNYFEDMANNIMSVRSALKKDGYYVLVVGDSTIRNINIPTGKILSEIAQKIGFNHELSFKYVIRDRYMHLPRGNNGGIIKYDEILVLRKAE